LLIGATQEAETGFDVAYLAVAEPSKIVRVTTSRFEESQPALSPNGRWIAYTSNETGRREIFVCDFPKGARKWQVSRSGGDAPTWRNDSSELYFAAPEGATAVSVSERSGALDFGTPERLAFSPDSFAFDFGVRSSDGKRFLVERYDSEAFTEPIRLVRNWRRLVEK
jgi:Tol biopolymer transport system component